MSISAKYRSYLSHFGRTLTCAQFQRDTAAHAVALRHDVDHDLDIALELARVEHDMGHRSTYFLLHTAGYWNDPLLAEKCLQLQDYGHEVGLHVNLLTEWMQGAIDDPGARLKQLLAPLREAGVRITGVSAHGDRACYEHGFINYWCFRELRSADPAAAENGRTAEGPHDPAGRASVAYPADHTLRRADGRTLALWNSSLAEAGIDYHAWHLTFDGYYSDSGGGWTRSADPIGLDLRRGRHQVLMHPLYWQGMKRTYFFLATARSGSKWLAQFLDTATPLAVRHEYMLNQAFADGEIADKPTASYGKLADDREGVSKLLADAWARRDRIDKDYAEVNVYLESQPDLLQKYFPEARYTLLTRDPRQVVRSIVNRGWYETPVDHAHRRVDTPDWASQGQFGRACLYVADTLRRLRSLCSAHIRLEEAVADLPWLVRQLAALDIVVHPRLAQLAHGTVVDATGQFAFPEAAQWSDEQGRLYDTLCAPEAAGLGYDGNAAAASATAPERQARVVQRHEAAGTVLCSGAPPALERWHLHGYVAAAAESRRITPSGPEEARRFATLRGYPWQAKPAKTPPSPRPPTLGRWLRSIAEKLFGPDFADRHFGDPLPGWRNRPRSWLLGEIGTQIDGPGRLVVFLLGFDSATGKLIQKKKLGVVSAEQPVTDIACRVHPDADRFDIGLYALAGDTATITVSTLRLRQEPMPQEYSALNSVDHD